jgi:hypothetical protein
MDGDGGDGGDGGAAMGGMDVGGAAGMNSTTGGSPNSGTSTLQSMGYNVDGGPRMKRESGESTDSKTQVLKSVIIKAILVLLGFLVVLFILMSILG